MTKARIIYTFEVPVKPSSKRHRNVNEAYNQAKIDVNKTSAATLHARLLGSPRFFYAGEPVRELRIQKAQALLRNMKTRNPFPAG